MAGQLEVRRDPIMHEKSTIDGRLVLYVPILSGDHNVSLLVKDHNHGNHGDGRF